MRIEHLKGNQLLEVIRFLNPKEILSFSLICKAFKSFLVKNQRLIQQMCLNYIGLEYSDSVLEWNQILQNLHETENSSVNLFLPYYTNGGMQDNSYYFFFNLMAQRGIYCSKNSENILFKYANASDAIFKYSHDPEAYNIQKNMFYIPEIENFAEASQDTCPYINKIRIELPTGEYTCPVQTLMCFSSLKKIEGFSSIDKFYNCKTHNSVIDIAKEHNINFKLLETKDYYTVLFDKHEQIFSQYADLKLIMKPNQL